ncbi:protein of unknown function [Bryocella elongata]|uniref:Galactose mutarotase n=1 Tax=Bryocella elongata TaxID=863522 RepID=A0A1H6CHR7_9BACT|nr:DUF4432 family protein [Bryocella elongata]SEG72514.1 protein of unknown function [Bryocella elongata]
MKASNDLFTVSLTNESLEATFLPAFGGKLISLISKRTGKEFLLPPIHPYQPPLPEALFDESDAGGFDECLPSVAACDAVGEEAAVPDHGDLWRVPWRSEVSGDTVRLMAEASSRPLRMTRTARLSSSILVLEYHIENLSDQPVTWLWSAHPLFAVEAGDRIILPREIATVTVEGSMAGDFTRGTTIGWPLAEATRGTTVDLSAVGEFDGRTAHKLFAEPTSSGAAALYRSSLGQGVIVRFDPRSLPYLGIWICHGAWPSSGSNRQYTVALEPTTSNVDSLAEAEQRWTHRTLGPREKTGWTIEFEIVGAHIPISYEQTKEKVNSRIGR